MRNNTSYEWDIETVDEYGDIQDHDHRDSLSEFRDDYLREALKGEVEGQEHLTLCLVRDVGNEHKGVIDRQWAYVQNGVLPKFFQDANGTDCAAMPYRFQQEFAVRIAYLALSKNGEAKYKDQTIRPTHDQKYTITGHDSYNTIEAAIRAIDKGKV